MKKIIILQGPPACGKSTLAKQLHEKDINNVIICRDSIRESRGQYWLPEQETYIDKVEKMQVESALECGLTPIIDATNLNKKTIKKWEELAKQYDVEFEYFTSSAEIVKTSDHYPLDLSGKQNAKKCFKNCQLANHCIFLKNGKLYTCAIAPNIEHFNKFFGKNLALENKDGIDIYKAKSEKQILTFLAKPIPFCKYCNVQGRVFGKNQWGISKKSIEEWT